MSMKEIPLRVLGNSTHSGVCSGVSTWTNKMFSSSLTSRPSTGGVEINHILGYLLWTCIHTVRQLVRFTPQSTAGASQRKGSIRCG